MIRTTLLIVIFCVFNEICSSQQSTIPVKVEFLKKMPEELAGVGEVYTYDSVSLKKEKYLLATDYTNGIIRINGKDITLKLIKRKELSSKKTVEVYEGNGYTVTIKTNINRWIDYMYTSRGTMEIKKGSVIKIIKIQCEGGD